MTIQAQILELLRELQRELGTAILLITHDLGVVNELADRIAVMYAGRIVEEGDARRGAGRRPSPLHPGPAALDAPRARAAASASHEIAGVVPPPRDWPAGCRFSTRCDRVLWSAAGASCPTDAGSSREPRGRAATSSPRRPAR